MPVEVSDIGDPITGDNSNNILWDTWQAHNIYGLDGNDVILASEYDYSGTDDFFHGGSGIDTVHYVYSDSAITANLTQQFVTRYNSHLGQTDYDGLWSIENAYGSNHADHLIGSSVANVLNGLAGADSIWGEGGADQIWGGTEADFLHGGTGNDTINGGDDDDHIWGDNDADSLDGGDGNDTLDGGSGNDTLDGGSGNDVIDGGSWTDTVVYDTAGNVIVNLWLGDASGALGNDTIQNVENVQTGSGNDIVYGSFGANKIETGGGNDYVLAFDGHDTVYGGGGNDSLHGYEGNDVLNGSFGEDELYGSVGADTLDGGNQDDTLDGGDGNDVLNGGGWEDLLRGGEGADTVTGGTSADVFRWEAGDLGQDFITDFNPAQDRLSFGEGFFAVEPVGATDLGDVLFAFPADFGNDAVLVAHTTAGWQSIAQIDNGSAAALNAMIADESILAVSLNDGLGGGAGGFEMLG